MTDTKKTNGTEESKVPTNFIHQIIEGEIAKAKGELNIHTRFPPEPNGYLHIGHAKSICLNFGTAQKYGGITNLRFDDTNPSKESTEYVDSIKNDIKWLGFDWGDREYYTSDYFDKLYDFAVALINKGLAYVDFQNQETISAQRGTPTRPGTESPYRNTTPEENLAGFEKMKAGEYDEGDCVLRAKIDMASPNMHMRDPLLYRIMKVHHHRTDDKWCIYPIYDFAHGQGDYWENITHSICTLEFEVHRPLYDWFIEQLKEGEYRPQQIEFSRLNLSYTIMSKRNLLALVENGHVTGWDDPRMPTISGLKRRGYTPVSIRNFCDKIGITKTNGVTDVALLEHAVREDLNKTAQRVMGVVNPLKVVITNYPEDQVEELDAVNNPEDPSMGKRKVPFTREIYIEKEDFMENAPRKFFRLSVGKEVRLRYAYFITCNEVIKDENGEIIELRCTYDPASKGGTSPDGRKVKGTLHWVSTTENIEAEVRDYDRLFNDPSPSGHKDKNYLDFLNPDSLKVLNKCYIEPFVKDAKVEDHFQFERLGYFNVDKDSTAENMVFNKTVGLRDSWSKK
ncbi:glutamine--tRNA ligase/YqeY domain fusion protein [Halosquirtibacter laminarini]|uniref:Glutamine--tRNA ligase/YqeY domain fusion protein n=1 Tax=Halosquirtibacter laminarini TaxID=3374600 RepID=A0AC61NF28_9BACT|nr:glutamine--tRNA ligase/YqeY domain fusion protein [Prolixibacteraceae bacterium]